MCVACCGCLLQAFKEINAKSVGVVLFAIVENLMEKVIFQ